MTPRAFDAAPTGVDVSEVDASVGAPVAGTDGGPADAVVGAAASAATFRALGCVPDDVEPRPSAAIGSTGGASRWAPAASLNGSIVGLGSGRSKSMTTRLRSLRTR